MSFEPLPPGIVERLLALPTLSAIPRPELEWLARHGRLRRLEIGEFLARSGQLVEPMDYGLEILLKGQISVHVDRGAGPRKVMEWQTGDLTGILPFSRMATLPGDVLTDAPAELLSVHRRHFADLVRECPELTATCVHVMLDRARVFTTSDWQDEKMISLGKLSAGLAHELNNPASAVARSGRLLKSAMDEADRAAGRVAMARLSEAQMDAVQCIREACSAEPPGPPLSPLERADREDALAQWLDEHGADHSALDALGDTPVTLEAMDELARHIQGDALDAALDWVAAGCAVRRLASESERAGTRISELVGAMKRLTHMDRAPALEPVDVEQRLGDALMILGHKARGKSVSVKVEVAPELPRVNAVAGQLDQVWMNLLDNALDAVDVGGHVAVTVKPEGRRLVVRVIDDGPGIRPADQGRVFDPFFTTKAPGQGTGLGLEIARTQVRGHGGEIEFDSRPGRTEFKVSLPLPEALSAAAAAAPPAAAPA